jgi:hypothetical protein
MLVAMDSNIEVVYVKLLAEGTDVYRPAEAIKIKDGIYKINIPANYDQDDEEWEFIPGSLVECELMQLGGKFVMVASRAVR